MLSHDSITFGARVLNRVYQLGTARENLLQGRQLSAVSFLPLSHVGGVAVDIYMMLCCGGTTYFADRDALKVRDTFCHGLHVQCGPIGVTTL